MSEDALLSVRDLRVRFVTRDAAVTAVDSVSLEVAPGEIVGIVGESGSGKSVTSMAIMGLLPKRGVEVSGSVTYRGTELLGAEEATLARVRGRDLAMVFQDPMSSLNPVMTVGSQITEVIRRHTSASRGEARAQAIELLDRCGIPDPSRRFGEYPHQLSGGMRQRALIAMALACGPQVLICDEPTTALDVTIQAQVLELLAELVRESGTAMIMITHDLGVVAGLCDHVHVMYAGRVVERAPRRELFARPRHRYTAGLLASVPRWDAPRGHRLEPIPGTPRDTVAWSEACAFAPRCAAVGEDCVVGGLGWVADDALGAHHAHRCLHPLPVGEVGETPPPEPSVDTEEPDDPADVVAPSAPPALEVTDLRVHYPIRGGLVLDRTIGAVKAVDGVSLAVPAGDTLGLVGESGCGKSTLGRAILQLERATSGSVRLGGVELTETGGEALRRLRPRMQMVFQDPLASLDPRQSIESILTEPLRAHGLSEVDRAEFGADSSRSHAAKVRQLLDLVGLPASALARYPHEFSGGQRQRIGIARALVLHPELIVADEPVSALDVSVQAQVINLLEEIQQRLGVTYVVIAHDLAVVRHIADRIAVMYLGVIVEEASADDLHTAPLHPYTKALLSAIPVPDPAVEDRRRRILLAGDLPSPADPPTGCRFSTRCPFVQPERCTTEAPALQEIAPRPPLGSSGGPTPAGTARTAQSGGERPHRVACHWATEIAAGTLRPRAEAVVDGTALRP